MALFTSAMLLLLPCTSFTCKRFTTNTSTIVRQSCSGCYSVFLTFARSSATSTPAADEAWTEVTSIRRSLCIACMTRSRRSSLCGQHRSSSTASLSMMDACTSAMGVPVLLLQQLMTLASAALAVPAVGRLKWRVLTCEVSGGRAAVSICRDRDSRSWLRLRSCFRYSIVSPRMEALSICRSTEIHIFSVRNIYIASSLRMRWHWTHFTIPPFFNNSCSHEKVKDFFGNTCLFFKKMGMEHARETF
jgi:hypothetical protein